MHDLAPYKLLVPLMNSWHLNTIRIPSDLKSSQNLKLILSD